MFQGTDYGVEFIFLSRFSWASMNHHLPLATQRNPTSPSVSGKGISNKSWSSGFDMFSFLELLSLTYSFFFKTRN